jgi:hypothetical protein
MPPGRKPTHWGSDYGIFFDADHVWWRVATPKMPVVPTTTVERVADAR